ncbi:MAG: (2Fe-2S)-binding protein [Synergistaceae bacterium]|nr:(2Fe-2S)-binding protein [Synergistaceae bacterium]
MILEFNLNGNKYIKDTDPSKRLVDFLRDDMGLTGTKESCGEGECGACTVIVDRKAVSSCLVLTGQINHKSVLTVEGLADPDGSLSPLQKAFIKHGAVQCGYCTPGMLMSATALLYENHTPTEEDVRIALAGNLCRCGDYSAIVDAVLDVAGSAKKAGK